MPDKIKLSEGYTPSETEEYMNPDHLQYFKEKLENWRKELIDESNKTLYNLKTENHKLPDENDQASEETERALELRTRDRYRKLLDKIDDALDRIERREYGYCEDTGEKIGLKRLQARPIATLCIEAQERHENYENTHMDEDRIG